MEKVTMEKTPFCAPESKFLLAPTMVPTMTVPWAIGRQHATSSNIGEVFAEQPDSPVLQKVMSISEDNSDHAMNRITNNSTCGNPIAAYSTIEIDQSSDIADTNTDASSISLEQPMAHSSHPRNITLDLEIPTNNTSSEIHTAEISIVNDRSVSPTAMGDDSRFESIIVQQYSTPNVSTLSGQNISAFGLSPIGIPEDE